MADKIRILVESMMVDMLYFVKKGVFTKQEAKQIIKDRENHEYALSKKSVKLSEFLKTIQYEYDLEKRRKERYLDLQITKEMKKDFQIVMRIIQLYDKLTYKYRTDVNLWKQYLAYCYSIKSKKTFFKAVTNALKFNAGSTDLWLLAIYYEFEINNNPFKARDLFHQAIQLNGKNMFEIKFIEQILKRKEFLSQKEANPEQQNELQNDFLAFDQKKQIQNNSSVLIQIQQNEGDISLLNIIYETFKEQFHDKYIEFAIEAYRFIKSQNLLWLQPILDTLTSDIKQEINRNPSYQYKLFQLINDKLSFEQNFIDQFLQEYQIHNDNQFYQEMASSIVENYQKQINFYCDNLENLIQKLIFKELFSEAFQLIVFSNYKNDNFIKSIFEKYIYKSKDFDIVVQSTNIVQNIENADNIKNISINILQYIHKRENPLNKDQILKIIQNLISCFQIHKFYDLALCQQMLRCIYSNFLVYKTLLQSSLLPLLQLLSSPPQPLLHEIYDKMNSLNQNCPLEIYLHYLEFLNQGEEKAKIREIIKRVVIWYPKEWKAWIAYLRYEKLLGKVQNCPAIYQNALKNIGGQNEKFEAEYQALFL